MVDLLHNLYMTISMLIRLGTYCILTAFVTQFLLKHTKNKPKTKNRQPFLTTLKPKL